MNFEAYLAAKKIDPVLFSKAEPDLFTAWKTAFEQMHPNSFTMQKLNLINAIRRKYLLKEKPAEPSAEASRQPAKPVMKPKPRPKF